MGRKVSALIAVAIASVNVFVASLIGLMTGGLPGLIGGVLVGLCVSAPMLPRFK
jgi:hypothetical protein